MVTTVFKKLFKKIRLKWRTQDSRNKTINQNKYKNQKTDFIFMKNINIINYF